MNLVKLPNPLIFHMICKNLKVLTPSPSNVEGVLRSIYIYQKYFTTSLKYAII